MSVAFEQLERVERLRRVVSWLENRLAMPVSERTPLGRIPIREGGRIFFLVAEEIDWIDAAGRRTRIRAGDKRYDVVIGMNAIEGMLDPRRFVRVHRSTIVNLDRILEVVTSPRGDYALILVGGERRTLSRSYRKRLPLWPKEAWRPAAARRKG